MAEAVERCHKRIDRLRCDVRCDDGIERLTVGVSEEHRFDVRIVHTNMFHTVFLLVAAGKFVLFDCTIQIVIDVCAYYKTILSLSVHCLGVYIILLLLVLNEPSVILELSEILRSLRVNFGRMFVRAYGKINFGADNMVQRLFVVSCLGTCLLRIKNIVRAALHLLHD